MKQFDSARWSITSPQRSGSEGKISVVIPVRNEEKNVEKLIEQLYAICTSHNFLYELIFVDDYSTDHTRNILRSLAKKYPIVLHIKNGTIGKAQSFLEGFQIAQNEIICTVDINSQYQLDIIPAMVAKILSNKADIVVANRRKKTANVLVKIINKGYQRFCINFLHNLTCDVQSGLKVFRKEILPRIHLDPTPWTFDLDFLLNARNAGYRIDCVDMAVESRESEENLIGESLELGIAAFAEKFADSKIVPFPQSQTQVEGQGFHYNGQKFIHYTNLSEHENAFYRVTPAQASVMLSCLLLFIVGLITQTYETLVITLSVLCGLYFLDLLFNFFVIVRSLAKPSVFQIDDAEIHQYDFFEWPVYTILCPLYKEWEVLPQFVSAIDRLEYPKEKLQVLLLLEQNDTQTIRRAYTYNLPPHFQIELVPDGLPKTKPKALNYGLHLTHGEYVVVYDAEDVPDPLQLKKSVLAFRKSDSNIICMQAKLHFYNSHQNLLTRLFTAEYSLWFDVLLPGLQTINGPMPLGGTSNHFKTDVIRTLRGWDAFNVTEDCDLGIRLFKKGYKTAIIESTTYEEANSKLGNWLSQRSRWIKGYIQTYFVHMRDIQEFFKPSAFVHFFTFQLIVGGKIISLVINPLMWLITINYFLFRSHIGQFIESLFPPIVLYIGVISLVFGNFLYLYYYMIGCAKRGHFGLVKFAFLVPVYWLGMSVASWIAVYHLVIKPYYWAKTLHGFHLRKPIGHTISTFGKDFAGKYVPFA